MSEQIGEGRDWAQQQGSEAGGALNYQTSGEASGTSGTKKDWTEKVGDTASNVASQVGGKTQVGINAGKGKAADGMEKAADVLRDRMAENSGIPAKARKMASTLDRTAVYLREHSTGEMFGDLGHYLHKHPAQTLTGAVVAGFLAAKVSG